MNEFLDKLADLMEEYDVVIESDLDNHTINIVMDYLIETNSQNINTNTVRALKTKEDE
jgi:uncharacterized protein with GYD domain